MDKKDLQALIIIIIIILGTIALAANVDVTLFEDGSFRLTGCIPFTLCY